MYSLHPHAQEILEYIRDHQDMSLSEIARKLGYTRQHVSYIYRMNYEKYGYGKLSDRQKKQAKQKNSVKSPKRGKSKK